MLLAKVREKTRGFLIDVVEKAVTNVLMNRKRFDLEVLEHLLAGVESAKFRRESMPGAKNLVYRSDLLEFAVSQVNPHGLWLEFGVYKGKSIRRIAAQTRNKVYGFDSFEGLPADWILSYRKGDFSLRGAEPQGLPSNVKLVKGLFEHTLPDFLETHEGPVAFLHIDCDLYTSTKTVLSLLRDRLAPGTVIVFDEFFNFPRWQEHEYRAFVEFAAEARLSYVFIGYASSYNSAALRVTAIPGVSSGVTS